MSFNSGATFDQHYSTIKKFITMSVKSLARTNGLSSVLSDFLEPWGEWFQNGFADKSLTLPAVNITETDKEYKLSLAAPGLDKKDFNVDVDGNLLTISAEKEKSAEEKDKNYTRKEYNYSSFSRCFTLPEEVSKEKIDASYQDGVLNLVLPKNEKATNNKKKTINVK